MKKFLFILCALLITLPVCAQTIGTVDYRTILTNYTKAKQVYSELDDKASELQRYLLDKEKEVKFIPVSTENYLTLAKRPKNTILCKDKIKQTFNLEIRTWSEALEEFLHNLLFQVE